MRKLRSTLNGRIVVLQYRSALLADNPLNDPAERQFPVYLPPEYDHSNKRFPVMFDLAGYTSAGPSRISWKNFELSIPERLDQMICDGDMPACIVVFPDCFTSLGGNQYVNSPSLGPYADYLTTELIPFVDRELRTKPTAKHRACYGKSSGGYGALIHGMRYAKHWGAIGAHSPDCYFDFVYRSDWPGVLTHLQHWAEPSKVGTSRARRVPGKDDGRIERFLEYAWSNEKLSGMDITALMLLCMSATYDPKPDHPTEIQVPFDLHTGAMVTERWRRWLAADPIRLVKRYSRNLQSLRGIFIDCGRQDQYHLHFGTRQLSQQLKLAGVRHRYEEFPGTHSGIDHRLHHSLPYLARRIS